MNRRRVAKRKFALTRWSKLIEALDVVADHSSAGRQFLVKPLLEDYLVVCHQVVDPGDELPGEVLDDLVSVLEEVRVHRVMS